MRPRRAELPRATRAALLAAIAGGCAAFGPQTDPAGDAKPATGRRVAVQFHLAGDAPREGRIRMQAAGGAAYVESQPALTRADVETARAYHGDGGSFVEIVFNFEGRQALAELTRAHVGERLAILIDGELHAAPKIAGEVDNGRAFISQLAPQTAEAVAASLTR